jgi:hypothetical protein
MRVSLRKCSDELVQAPPAARTADHAIRLLHAVTAFRAEPVTAHLERKSRAAWFTRPLYETLDETLRYPGRQIHLPDLAVEYPGGLR